MRDSEAYKVTWLVRRLFRAMASKSTDSLQNMGISAADRAVLEFLFPDRALSVPDIASRYDVSRQHVQVTVNRLIEKNLLNVKPNPRHKRSPLMALTREGRGLLKRVLGRDAQLLEELFSDIPVNNVKVTARTLQALYAKLHDQEDL
jgi:DNA-binding MarR family transcriptional regulator